MPIKTIFLDRDGVVNKDINYLHKINDFEFIDGVFESCRLINQLGYEIIIITNQSGIARGYFSELDYQRITNWMIDEFNKNNVKILDTFHCPHSPNSKCGCRKPKPGMFLEAINKHDINTSASWMVGDSERDITAANLAGIEKTILVRSGHKIDEKNSNASHFLNSINGIDKLIF